MKTMVSVGLLSLILANEVFAQSTGPIRATECRGAAQQASKDLYRITSKAVANQSDNKEARRAPPDDLSSEVRNSVELKEFLRCLSERRSSLQK